MPMIDFTSTRLAACVDMARMKLWSIFSVSIGK